MIETCRFTLLLLLLLTNMCSTVVIRIHKTVWNYSAILYLNSNLYCVIQSYCINPAPWCIVSVNKLRIKPSAKPYGHTPGPQMATAIRCHLQTDCSAFRLLRQLRRVQCVNCATRLFFSCNILSVLAGRICSLV